jgi:hypothetical protein
MMAGPHSVDRDVTAVTCHAEARKESKDLGAGARFRSQHVMYAAHVLNRGGDAKSRRVIGPAAYPGDRGRRFCAVRFVSRALNIASSLACWIKLLLRAVICLCQSAVASNGASVATAVAA